MKISRCCNDYLLIWLVILHILAHVAINNATTEGGGGGEVWWRVHPTSHDAFDPIRSDALLLTPSDIDDASIHSCYEYKLYEGGADVDWNGYLKGSSKKAVLLTSGSFCYPSIIITGVRKCSTSALYALFESFPMAITNKVKENCAFIAGSRSIIQYFESLPNYIDAGKYIIDGCVDLKGNLVMREILHNPRTYYIVMTRNYETWLWSAYNYWCKPSYEDNCDRSSGHWAIPGLHLRSSGYFHEIVLGSVNGTYVPNPFTHNNSCTRAVDMYEGFVYTLLTKTISDQVSVFASEELERSPDRIWRKISTGAGVPVEHPALAEFKNFRYNTQLQKERGASVKLEINKYKSGVYEISNFETVFPETKKMLDTCWQKDCLYTSNITGFKYSACGGNNEMADKQFSSLNLRFTGDGNTSLIDVSTSNLISSVLGSGSSVPNMNGYLNSNMRSCFIDISRLLNKHKDLDTAVFGSFEPIFIVSNHLSDVALITRFLYLGIGIDFSLILYPNSTDVSADKCKKARFIGVESSMVEVISSDSDGGGSSVRIKDSYACGRVASSRKAVLLTRDPLSIMWRDYQLKEIASYSESIVGQVWLSSDQIHDLNWTSWDVHVDVHVERYVRMTFHSVQSEMISTFKEDNLLLASIENFIGKDRVDQIMKIIDLLTSSSLKCNDCKDRLALKQHIAASYDNNIANCGRVVLASSNIRADIIVGKKFLDIAFASQNKLCKLKERFSANHIAKIVPILSALKNSTCDAINMVYDRKNQCKLRYTRRRFIKNIVKPPVALVATDVPAVHTRLLMEHATGLLTGAANTNHTLFNMFQGEFACGQRMVAIHAATSLITPLFTKSGSSSISLNPTGKRKCMRGMMRGFAKGILMIKDPLKGLFENCSSLLGYQIDKSKELDSSHYSRSSAIVQCLIYSAKFFNMEWLDEYGQIALLDNVFSKNELRNDILIVSYESLIANRNKVDILHHMLDFAHHGDQSKQRIECAFSFVDSRYLEKEVNKMMSFYRGLDQSLLCEILHTTQVYQNKIQFRFRHLAEDFECPLGAQAALNSS